MRFQNNIFGEYCSAFINNALYSKTKYDAIKEAYTNLEDILISGELSFPKLNSTVTGLIDSSNMVFFSIYDSLIRKENNTVTGFDNFKISEVTTASIDDVLSDLPSQYQGLQIQLQNIYKYINKNIDHYNKFLYLVSNLDVVLNKELDIQNFDYYTNLFRFMYNKPSLSINEAATGLSNKHLLSIPVIMQLYFFKQLYYQNSQVVNNILDSINNKLFGTAALDRSYLSTLFYDYLKNNNSLISVKLKDFIINNALSFGLNVSSNIASILHKIIYTQQDKYLSETILKVGDKMCPAEYIYKIIDNAFSNNCYANLIHTFTDPNSFVWNLDLFAMYDTEIHQRMYMNEDVIRNNLNTYFKKTVEDVQLLICVPIKFTNNPIFFINAHSLVFSRYALNFIQDTGVFTYNDIDTWLQNCLKINEAKINNIFQFVNNNPLTYDEYSFKFAAFLILKEAINTLIDSDEFINFLSLHLIPSIDSEIKKQYKIDINWNEYIEPILNIYRNIFLNEFIHTLDDRDSSKPFYTIIKIIEDEFINHIQLAKPTLNKDILRVLSEYEIGDNKKWYYLFNSFFKCSFTSMALEKYLQDNYSLN